MSATTIKGHDQWQHSTAYVIFKNTSDGQYYAKSMIQNGQDYFSGDAATAINAAINATFNNGGGQVKMRKGTHQLSASVMMRDTVDFLGEGWNTVFTFNNNANYPAFDTNNTEDVRFKLSDIKIDGSTASGKGASTHGVRLFRAQLCQVERVWVNQTGGSGLDIENTPQVEQHTSTVKSSFFFKNANHGIFISSVTPDWFIFNNEIGQQGGDGIFVQGTDVQIVMNHIYLNGGNPGGTGNGLEFSSTEATVMGNNIDSNGIDGIYLHDTANGYCTISGNIIRRNGQQATGAGVHIKNYGRLSVLGNEIIDAQVSPTQKYGVWFDTGAGVASIIGNDFFGNLTSAIQGTITAGSQVWGNKGAGNDATGGGSAALGSNCPAITVSAPYTWMKTISSDGSTVYIPVWK